ncbi:MAG: hypothetical protein U0974_09410 [Gemmatimonadales bacterium]|nr:hypothetical protein [Gemmatimonadales bacterium]MDZ4389935.1 hypothetical protein [Gemmatimonadales bacterium]
MPLAIAVGLTVACSSSPSAENAIADAAVGTWIGEEIGLLVSADNMLLSVPCIGVLFPAITPAPDGSFELLGTIVGSPKGGSNGRPARLAGRLLVDSIQVGYALNLNGDWPEPINRVLTRDDSANFVVNATCIQ